MVLSLVLSVCAYIAVAIFAAIVLTMVAVGLLNVVKKYYKVIITVTSAAIVAAAFFGLLHGAANAEKAADETLTVVIVYYEEDTFIVEDKAGNRNIYDERGDLMPGDQISIVENKIILVSQSDWDIFDYSPWGEPAASFIYPEDAAEVREHVKQEQPSG